jgi:hypothetical protein
MCIFGISFNGDSGIVSVIATARDDELVEDIYIKDVMLIKYISVCDGETEEIPSGADSDAKFIILEVGQEQGFGRRGTIFILCQMAKHGAIATARQKAVVI